MQQHLKFLLAIAAIGVVAGCAERASTGVANLDPRLLADVYASAAPGYDSVASSYSASGNTGTFAPRRGGDGRSGPGAGGPGMRGLMGGGFGDDFAGGRPFGPGRGRGPFGDSASLANCTFDTAAGLQRCSFTRDSLTFARTQRFTNASGAVQTARDSTTNTIVSTSTVSGSTTFSPRERRGFGPGFGPGGEGGPNGAGVDVMTARTEVNNSSARTVTGLAAGSTQRTINGTSNGRESTTGTGPRGAFSSVRVMADTTTGLVIPLSSASTTNPYPTAGRVVRTMNVTVSFDGGTPQTSARREVVTYDGSATATVVITQDGTTRNCTLPLPRGQLSCQ
jgi:hypothetical protein